MRAQRSVEVLGTRPVRFGRFADIDDTLRASGEVLYGLPRAIATVKTLNDGILACKRR